MAGVAPSFCMVAAFLYMNAPARAGKTRAVAHAPLVAE